MYRRQTHIYTRSCQPEAAFLWGTPHWFQLRAAAAAASGSREVGTFVFRDVYAQISNLWDLWDV